MFLANSINPYKRFQWKTKENDANKLRSKLCQKVDPTSIGKQKREWSSNNNKLDNVQKQI